MATFNYTPDYSAQESSNPAVNTVKLGDGYEQRYRFGLNSDMKTWSLTFSNRDDNEADAITDFFEARGGWDNFTWTHPTKNTTAQYICSEWSRSIVSYNRNTIQATFRQVPEAQ